MSRLSFTNALHSTFWWLICTRSAHAGFSCSLYAWIVAYVNVLLPGCYVTYRRGFRMNHRLVRDSIHVRNLVECELECSRTRPFTCQSFQFRQVHVRSFTLGISFINRVLWARRRTNLGGGYDRNPYNCELSELPARDFDRFSDLIEDQDYELFTRSQSSSCAAGLIGMLNNIYKCVVNIR